MNFLSKIQGSLSGVMLGDALGMPWEIYSAAKILELTEGAGVTGFTSPVFRKLAETEKLTLGSTTDDWQLTEAILKSLVRRGSFDIMDMALAHVEAYETGTAGWGGTTRKGLEELQLYFNSRGRDGRSPLVTATGINGKGLGNGIGMKIAPVPLFLATRMKNNHGKIAEPTAAIAFLSIELQEWTVAIGKLTHPDFRATVGGYALSSIIFDILMFDLFKTDGMSPLLETRWLIKRTIEICRLLEEKMPGNETDVMSTRLSSLLNESLLFGSIDKLRQVIGTNCMALESITFAIAVFLRHPTDFKAGLLEAVNSGGDTDTIAAMVGSLIGAVVGVEGIPTEWMQFNPEFGKALTLGQELYEAAQAS